MVGKLTFYNTNTTYTRDSDLKPPPPPGLPTRRSLSYGARPPYPTCAGGAAGGGRKGPYWQAHSDYACSTGAPPTAAQR